MRHIIAGLLIIFISVQPAFAETPLSSQDQRLLQKMEQFRRSSVRWNDLSVSYPSSDRASRRSEVVTSALDRYEGGMARSRQREREQSSQVGRESSSNKFAWAQRIPVRSVSIQEDSAQSEKGLNPAGIKSAEGKFAWAKDVPVRSASSDTDVSPRVQTEVDPDREGWSIFKQRPDGGGTIFKATVGYNVGLRRDDLTWHISGDLSGANPNVLSELEWKDIESIKHEVNIQTTWFDRFVFNASGAFSDIEPGGYNIDSDYLLDDRQGLFSQTTQDTDDGELYDLSSSFGYEFFVGSDGEVFLADELWFTPLVGYSYHQQKFRNSGGPFDAVINGTYIAEWEGPWYGFQLRGVRGKWSGLVRWEYHTIDYDGTAYWPGRAGEHAFSFALPSFFHSAEGKGHVFNFDAAYELTRHWRLNFNVDIQNWRTWEGLDVIQYQKEGLSSGQQLTEVDWDTYAFMLGASYHFN